MKAARLLSTIASVLYRIMKYAVIIMAAVVVIYLWLLAGFSTAVINSAEHTYLIRDYFIINLLIMVVFSAALYFIRSRSRSYTAFSGRVNSDPACSRRYRRNILLAEAAVCAAFLLLAQKQPWSDQSEICIIADEWMDHDYSAMAKGGYLDYNPHQIGIVLVLYLFNHIFGGYHYLVFQIANLAAVILISRTFANLSDLMGNSPLTGLLILLSSALFLPMIEYSTFIYGTLIGLAASLLVTKDIILFHQRRKPVYLIGIFLFQAAAIIMKQNYLIFAIANLILTVMLFLKKPALRFLAVLPVLILSLFITTESVHVIATRITGLPVSEGSSNLSYIAMGLQENDTRYDGWWNEYNANTYGQHSFNREEQEGEVKDYIKSRAREFLSDPEMAVRYFAGKNASQWNDPDFEGHWVNQKMTSSIRYARWINYLETDLAASGLYAVENYLQFLLLSGLILYQLLCRRKDDAFLFCSTAFLGGFIFHTFWEAKCQYTLPYFILLIPVSVLGYQTLLRRLSSTYTVEHTAGGNSAMKKRHRQMANHAMFRNGLVLSLTAAAILVIRFADFPVLNDIFLRSEDTEEYRQSLNGLHYVRLKSGTYRMTSPDGTAWLKTGRPDTVDQNKGPVILESMSDPDNGNSTDSAQETESVTIEGSEYDNQITILIDGDRQALDVASGIGEDGEIVQTYQWNRSPAQKWRLKNAGEDNTYYLYCQVGYVLTRDYEDGCLILTTPDGSDEQKWKIVPTGK